ncbi:MAG: DNA methylase [Clostridia bacterium]|nr:DNA methylase [Clostridia bacterium]
MYTPSSSKTYIAIDLKSFYASVECMERGRDPLTTNLVVADESRTEKTICLAVSPSLKALGVSGRARLFEALARVKEVNLQRKQVIRGAEFEGESDDARELAANKKLAVGFIIAKPQMRKYMEVSSQIYEIYMKHVAPEDVHVYSVDEVFIDATDYLSLYKLSAREFAMRLVRDVLRETGITATAGIGTNLYLAKIAMDIVAKHIPADKDGVRIAELDETSYREKLWSHRPLTDFWRIGKGISERLARKGIYTMGDIALCSLRSEETLYKEFGVNAELLIDHAWGWEPCEIKDIRAYVPDNNSLSVGQVLTGPYAFDAARVVITEMADGLVLDMVEKRLVCDQIVLTVGYDIENINCGFAGTEEIDRYGRRVPKQAHGSINLGSFSSSTRLILEKTCELFDRIVDRNLTVRRMYVVANHVVPEGKAPVKPKEESLFDLLPENEEAATRDEAQRLKEKQLQKTTIDIKNKFGKNALLKGLNFKEGATAIERNQQVGGHKA